MFFGASCFRRRADRSATSGGNGVGSRVSGEPVAKVYGMNRVRRSVRCDDADEGDEEDGPFGAEVDDEEDVSCEAIEAVEAAACGSW